MGHRIYTLFMAVNKTDITLPVSNWLDNSNIWKLFEDARDRQSDNILFQLHGKSGLHLLDILQVVDRCDLNSLKFLNLDLLESDRGTILQGYELVVAIRSLTIIISELLNTFEPLICLYIGSHATQESMTEAFNNSQIFLGDLDLDPYQEEGLFILLKSLLWVMNDALVNNKLFVYFMFIS